MYAGIHEFYDMGFVMHALRDSDTFIDIGANVGSYTVLAGSAVGASCISIEPVPSTFTHLVENIELNSINDRVDHLNIALGETPGKLRFSTDKDTMNHVIAESEDCQRCIEVEVKSLDDVVRERVPTVIKMDVEGWEANVVAGAKNILSQESPLALIMEFGLGKRYGFNEKELYSKILDFGFSRVSYHPFERTLTPVQGTILTGGNALFVNNVDYFKNRVKLAPQFKALGVKI